MFGSNGGMLVIYKQISPDAQNMNCQVAGRSRLFVWHAREDGRGVPHKSLPCAIKHDSWNAGTGKLRMPVGELLAKAFS